MTIAVVKDIAEHPVHARADRGNAAAYFSFPDIKSLEAHVSEIPPASSYSDGHSY